MRLGQLARKYKTTIQEIVVFLEEKDIKLEKTHPNSSIDERIESLLKEQFEVEEAIIEEVIEVESIPAEVDEEHIVVEEISEVLEEEALETETITEEEDVVIDNETMVITEENETIEPETETVEEEIEIIQDQVELETIEDKKEDEASIESDRLLKLLEEDENNVDLSKISLIKAPKKKLEGLKVVGKIDLPETKFKEEEVENSEPTMQIDEVQLSEEITEADIQKAKRIEKKKLFREKQEQRRLRDKEKQEAFIKRQEKRRIEKEIAQKRAKKEAHYKQKLEQGKQKKVVKSKSTSKKQKGNLELQNTIEDPKSFWGRFWKWLNT